MKESKTKEVLLQNFSIEDLYNAFLKAKRGKKDKNSILKFESELMVNLTKLQHELDTGTYEVSEYKEFSISCPNGKTRDIKAPNLRDSIVQHAIYARIYDIFDRKFIHDNYGCRKYKGTHKAADKCQEYMRKYGSESYYLQMDIRKYYFSINHSILRKALLKVLHEDDVHLMMKYVDHVKGIGLIVGNLLSQLYGILYLNEFDHFVKRVLKRKHYIRYVDDTVIFGLTRAEAYKIRDLCVLFLKERADLELSMWKINKIRKGINFVGYRTWKSKRFIRKRSIIKFNRDAKKGKRDSLQSILAHAKDTSSWRYLYNIALSHGIELKLPDYLQENINKTKQETL